MSATGSAVPASKRVGFVALAGRPNVGKSTLLNQMVGLKVSIVSDKPQTTRNRISGIVHRPDAEVVLVDTPGIHRPLYHMNRRMLRAALTSFDGVDVVLVLTDVTEPFGGGDRYLVETLRSLQGTVFLAVNKIDLVKKPAILPVIQRWSTSYPFAEVFPISGATGEGVESLLNALVERLPFGAPRHAEDEYTDVSERFLCAEVVREKILRQTHDELPFSTTVLIESWVEPEDGARMLHIEASVLVDRASQKGILIGKQGQMIGRIGREARQELEGLLGRRLFLGLQVKVRNNWRNDERLLDRLGLT